LFRPFLGSFSIIFYKKIENQLFKNKNTYFFDLALFYLFLIVKNVYPILRKKTNPQFL